MSWQHLLRGLRHGVRTQAPPPVAREAAQALAEQLDQAARTRLGRSLGVRHVDTGGCGACVAEVRMLRTPIYDLERYGLRFVTSPRHADVLLVTGPVTANMAEALARTYEAMPDPKWVVAVGDCAADGGTFRGSAMVREGVESVMPVDLIVRGNPPAPAEILAGLLTLLEAHAG